MRWKPVLLFTVILVIGIADAAASAERYRLAGTFQCVRINTVLHINSIDFHAMRLVPYRVRLKGGSMRLASCRKGSYRSLFLVCMPLCGELGGMEFIKSRGTTTHTVVFRSNNSGNDGRCRETATSRYTILNTMTLYGP